MFLENKAFISSGRQDTNLGTGETSWIPLYRVSRESMGLGKKRARLWSHLYYILTALNVIAKSSLSYIHSTARIPFNYYSMHR